MTTDKIANAELEKLGFKKEEPKQDYGSLGNFTRKKSDSLDLFTQDSFDLNDDIPPFLDRRNKVDDRHKQHLPKVTTGRSTPQKQDALCMELADVGSTWISSGSETEVSQGDIEHIANLLATNMGNIIEHGGLIYKRGESGNRLKKLLSAYLKTELKHWNGHMYRNVKVVK